MRQAVELPYESQTVHQILGTRKVWDEFVTGVGIADVLKSDGAAVGKVHEGNRRRLHRGPGKGLPCVVFSLYDEVRVVQFHLFAFSFENGCCFPVDKEQVIGFEPPFIGASRTATAVMPGANLFRLMTFQPVSLSLRSIHTRARSSGLRLVISECCERRQRMLLKRFVSTGGGYGFNAQ